MWGVRVWVGGLRRETPVRFRQTRDTGGWGVLHAERAARALLRRTAALRWVGMVDLDRVVMILPQVHLRKPCYDFTFL